MMKKICANKPLIMDCLQGLNDREYQRRVWITGAGNAVSGLEDTIAALFDDSALDLALEKDKITFSLEIDKRFKVLGDMLKKLNRDLPTAEIIETEEWSEIRLYAEGLYKSIVPV